MFKDKFSNILREKNLSAYAIAKNTGISQGLMNEYKNGIKTPTIQNLIKIADCLDCSVDYLLGRDVKQSITTGDVTNNLGVIGHINSPTTINNSNTNLTPQKTALLELYDKLSVIKQAELLTYAANLEKE